ncbi:MAG TPA: TasA family protein [Acidimicrobiia bacterium]|nr:TasA family protein [Acidimicrobiia bacterium]
MGTGLILGVVGLVGIGAFATFTSTASDSQSATSGTMSLSVPGPGATNRLSVTASNIAPGDTIERAVDLISGGTLDISGFTLTTTATTSSLLDSDVTAGLQMVTEKCSVAWTESAPPYTYTCGGTTSTVLASSPWIQSNVALSNLSLTAGSTDHLRIKLTFPSAAGNTLQTQTSTVQYSFTATQRTAGPQ